MPIKTRINAVLIAALLAASGLAAAGEASASKGASGQGDRQMSWSFDAQDAGGAPAGAEVFGGAWAVRSVPDAPSPPNVLCQSAEESYPAIMLGSGDYRDVAVSTRFKPISGRIDQAAGLLFRIRDRDNYYIVRANALENNVNLYKYVRGLRFPIKEAAAPVASGKWQQLRVEASGERIRAFLAGQVVLDVLDGTIASGGVGLWTKADSQTCFDDVEIEAR